MSTVGALLVKFVQSYRVVIVKWRFEIKLERVSRRTPIL